MILLCKVYFFPQKTIKPGLVAFYDIRPGNGVGLFSKEKISKEKMKKKRISGEAHEINKQTIYIAPKSKIESRAHYAPEQARGHLIVRCLPVISV